MKSRRRKDGLHVGERGGSKKNKSKEKERWERRDSVGGKKELIRQSERKRGDKEPRHRSIKGGTIMGQSLGRGKKSSGQKKKVEKKKTRKTSQKGNNTLFEKQGAG